MYGPALHLLLPVSIPMTPSAAALPSTPSTVYSRTGLTSLYPTSTANLIVDKPNQAPVQTSIPKKCLKDAIAQLSPTASPGHFQPPQVEHCSNILRQRHQHRCWTRRRSHLFLTTSSLPLLP
ncbi:hypothetical protein LX32DRAFT_45051 [Colletotrichum zoysiae]|uniref:Uncharacterized protein n=1 Tax=Colletotrichum zoysiae TaxID=1216348 RepID=A0AAD9HBT5_9PEZI|nr:hypothetical protein LX32DRAFT_45051 [Colletotrichum zoysiae]